MNLSEIEEKIELRKIMTAIVNPLGIFLFAILSFLLDVLKLLLISAIITFQSILIAFSGLC